MSSGRHTSSGRHSMISSGGHLRRRERSSLMQIVRRYIPFLSEQNIDEGVGSSSPPSTKALKASVTTLAALEKERSDLHFAIMKLLKLTDQEFGLFRDRVAYAFMICGGGMIINNPMIPCDAVPVFVGLAIAVFAVSLCAACSVLYMNIYTMEPWINDLDNSKRAIAAKALNILEKELAPSDNDVFDLEVSSVSVMERLVILIKSGDKIHVKRNYTSLVCSNIGCVFAYAVILCFIAYYKHTSRSGCE